MAFESALACATIRRGAARRPALHSQSAMADILPISPPPISPPPPSGPQAPGPGTLWEETLRQLRFFTRLPLPVFRLEQAPHAAPDLARAAPLLALTGGLVGALGALSGLLAYGLGLSALLVAGFALATTLVVTGALHEDGFADCCDGFFGAPTTERRLEIMKDSRLGTFGAAGLMFCLLVRVLALGELFRLAGPAALLLLIGVGALARPQALVAALWLPSASCSGLARSIAMPKAPGLALAGLLGGAILLASAYPSGLIAATVAAAAAALTAIYGLCRLAAAKIGGYNGDVFGAAEQVAEMVMLLGLSAAANWHGPV